MAQQYAWRPFFWSRVDIAGRTVRSTRDTLVSAVDLLSAPITMADGVERLARAEHELCEASSAIGLALSAMGAVELTGIRHVASTDRREQRARACLQAARPLAKEVHDALRRSRGHLGAAGLLLARPADVPGADDLVESERVAAVREVEAAVQLAEDVSGWITVAQAPGVTPY